MRKYLSRFFESKKRKEIKATIESFRVLIAQRNADPMASASGTQVLKNRVIELERSL